MASLIFNWKRVEAESRILKQSSEHRERQFSEPLKCLNMWECLSEAKKCSEDCFKILDSASTRFQLKIKEAMHILWEQPSLNSQVKHLNLSLSY